MLLHDPEQPLSHSHSAIHEGTHVSAICMPIRPTDPPPSSLRRFDGLEVPPWSGASYPSQSVFFRGEVSPPAWDGTGEGLLANWTHGTFIV
jgi:hypothetical protein